MASPEEILAFWLDETGPSGWYEVRESLDDEIRDRFGPAWEKAAQGAHGLWLTYPSGTLAYIILTDQFPRNMFRGSGRAFDTDGIARTAAKLAIDRSWDMRIDEPARQFFYLPLMHSENLADQDRCVRLMKERMPEGGEANLLHAKAHREVIRRFGRFPYRNDALGRKPTQSEESYLEAGGYGQTVRELQAAG
ncbi:hypothetical protein OB2597_01197 [Pseudooceanicola batsensis HTCC2597]|uniref:DUF924 domain-containing protein n=1 Tax=Pseudooceanicola batsensis (strain ATCC BAA-863 / DSM 15984 / KCTC 12145 / HTCC2597) TaxID=252305 RepID=A3U2T2_PSEBH|nr:DUF924 family protein [Pseudooceanicola batsensis]EAQ01462.1 hypothetical protein OB2597_01197 [Pseudooceanicola batsensis HTCC2597]